MLNPSSLYQQEIEQGAIRSDPDQVTALVHIDRLHQELLAVVNRPWYQRFSRVAAPRGLYLWGGVGTGKTLLMDIFYRSLPEGLARRIHFHRFMQMVHDRRSRIKEQQNPLKLIAKELASRNRVLCLDEFAVTDITDAMILSGLLKVLIGEGVSLVTTSNIPPTDLYQGGLQRDRFLPAIELLRQHTRTIHVDSGNDYRMAFLRHDSIYHVPLNDTTAREISSSFEHLAGSYEIRKTEIELSARAVPVVATGSGVVWFEFSVLCQGNRSKMDYIEIAKRFHSVILANIPLLDELQNDAVRRLIELVDELYDRGVNLIISAEALPEQLYLGVRLAEPFKRTVSRLQEMSSVEYLGRPHTP